MIGDHVAIAAHCIIQSASHNFDSEIFAGFVKKIVIEDYVWLGNRVLVLAGVSLKKGAVVGANSLVSKDVAASSVVAGCPAREIKKRDKKALRYLLNYRPVFN